VYIDLFGSGRSRTRKNAADILRTGITRRPDRLANPATLLTARYEVVPFIEALRGAQLREIESWCAAPEPVGVRLFLGPGGTGKTRLFIEVGKRLRKKQWDAGFFPESVSEEDERDALEGSSSVLVVVDYAETHRELPRLLAAVAEVKPLAPRKVRVALVAREQADWWRLMLGLSGPVASLLNAHVPLTLRPEQVSSTQRRELFGRATQAFATELEKPLPSAVPDLADPSFGRPLYLTIAALAAVDGSNLPPDKLLSGTLDHETRYLKLHYFDDRSPLLREQMDFVDRALRLLAAATLRGGFRTREEAEAVSLRVRGPDDEHTPHALRTLHELYRARDGNDARKSPPCHYLAGLEPDLLGEELVARVLVHDETPSDYLMLVFDGASDAEVRQGFLVLGRLGFRGSEDRCLDWIGSVLNADLSKRVGLALDAALTLTRETALAPLGRAVYDALRRAGNVSLARELLSRIPRPTVALRDVAALAIESILATTPNDAIGERASLLASLGVRYSDLGRRDDALAATEEAVHLYRSLLPITAEPLEGPTDILSGLAQSLNTLGQALSDLGRRQEAVSATEEAVRHFRTLAATEPGTFLPELAKSLNSLGNRLGADRDGRDDALTATAEAVEYYYSLHADRPEAYRAGLATALNDLGIRFSDLGKWEDALDFTQQAVEHYRALVAACPDALLPDLTTSLSNVGFFLNELGRGEQALAPLEEAVQNYRKLAVIHPDAFLPNLAMSLSNLGELFSKLRRNGQALAATEEAVEITLSQAKAHPSVFAGYLKRRKTRLALLLAKTGRASRAYDDAEELLKILGTDERALS